MLLIDGRPLLDACPGGVTRLAERILPAVLTALGSKPSIVLTAGFNTAPSLSAQHIHRRISSKLISGLTMSGLLRFEQLSPTPADHLLLLNLGFIGRPKIPYSLVVHDISFLIEPRWFLPRARYWHNWVNAKRQIKNAKHLFAVSQTTKQDLEYHLKIPSHRINVLPLGIDPPVAPTELPEILQGKRFLLALGQRDPRKNIACITQAFHELIKDPSFKDVLLVQTGTNTRSTHPNIIHLRRPSNAALSSLMKHASLFLYPSWYEGFGLPLHEAAFYETPCLASSASCLPETAPNNVQFAPPTKPHLWTMMMKEMIKHPARYKTKTHARSWERTGEMIAEKAK